MYDGIATDYTAARAPAYAPPSPEVFWASTPAQRRIMLAELLEHEDKLPLRWDFEHVSADCGTAGCALGSVNRMWHNAAMPGAFSTDPFDDPIWNVFGWNSFKLYGGNPKTVTPAMVAAKLRSYVDPAAVHP